MRLVNYGVGEIVDRLTILDLKIAHGGGDHFVNERGVLLTKLRTTTNATAIWDAGFRLATVNGLLWHAEDELRHYREDTDGQPERDDAKVIAYIAFRIQELNDQRAGLIETINKLTGDHLGPEKING